MLMHFLEKPLQSQLVTLLVMMLISAPIWIRVANCNKQEQPDLVQQHNKKGQHYSAFAHSRAPILSMMNDLIASPHLSTGKATLVQVGIYVNAFDSINVETMDYSIQVFLRLNWHDDRLSFNGSASSNASITIDPRQVDNIWLPDIIFMNENAAKYHEITTPNKLLRVNPNGDVYYSSRISVVLGCNMELYKFPLDTQTCEINMESYRFTRQELQLQWREDDPFQLNERIQLPQFSLISNRTIGCDMLYISGQYPCLRVQFTLRRMYAVYLTQYYVPSTLIVILSWVSFWISIDAVPARISLGVMTVLSMTTQSMGLWMTLPKASYIKAIDLWMGVTVLYVFSALLEFALVNTLARNEIRRATARARANNNGLRMGSASMAESSTAAAPSGDNGEIWQRRLQPDTANDQPLLCHQCKQNYHTKYANFGSERGSANIKKLLNEYTYGDWKYWDPDSRQVARKIDKLSRFIFPISFAAFFFVYWCHFAFF